MLGLAGDDGNGTCWDPRIEANNFDILSILENPEVIKTAAWGGGGGG